jgi:hypothetical protein
VIVCLSELFGFGSLKFISTSMKARLRQGARLKTPQRNCRDLQATIQEHFFDRPPRTASERPANEKVQYIYETLTSATSLLHPPFLFFSVLHCTSTLGSTHSDCDFEGSGSVKEER